MIGKNRDMARKISERVMWCAEEVRPLVAIVDLHIASSVTMSAEHASVGEEGVCPCLAPCSLFVSSAPRQILHVQPLCLV